MGYAPDTTVEDGARFIRRYTVRKGDTLGSVAKRFGVIEAYCLLGEQPPESGPQTGPTASGPARVRVIYTVEITDTLEALARRLKINPQRIVTVDRTG